MMKGGLMKGLRYISQIFEVKEEEEEGEDVGGMQIGFPTDVKHVAHIGMDGPTITPPTWMNDYQSDPSNNSAATSPKSQDKKQSDRGIKVNSPGQDKPGKEEGQDKPGKENPSKEQTESNSNELPPPPPMKASRRHSSATTLAFQSSTTNESAVPRHSRRNKSTENATFEPLEQPPAARRGARKHNRVKENETGSDRGQDTSSSVPKPRRKKKSTRSASEDGSGRLSSKTDLGPDQ